MNKQFKKNLLLSLVFMILFFVSLIAYFNIRYLTSYFVYTSIIVLVVLLLVFVIIKNHKYVKESNKKIIDIIKNIILPILIIIAIEISIIKSYDVINNTNILRAIFSINAGGENFDLNTNNKYLITTGSKSLTMLSDGGSNYNRYYEIDLDKNSIRKLEDHYIGFKGYEYIGKIIYNKTINNDDAIRLKSLLDKVFSNTDTGLLKKLNKEETTNSPIGDTILYFGCYYFSNKDYYNVEVWNDEILNELKNILNE